MKKCARCNELKDIEQFSKNNQQKDGRHVYCKSCVKVYSSNFYIKNREEIIEREKLRRAADPEGRKEYNLDYRKRFAIEIRDARRLKKYGITAEDWDILFERQGKVCAICRTQDPEKRGWQTDHDHKTKKVRGILCNSCNNGLGRFKDNSEALIRASQYLRE